MALRTRTIEYTFDTRTTPLNFGTTVINASRHDFDAITLYIPETTSRTFLSVITEVGWRDGFGTVAGYTTQNINGYLMGIKLGSANFSDQHYAITALANTGDHEYSFVQRSSNIASYFNSNFGSGSSQTCQLGFAISAAAGTPRSVCMLVGKVIITYQFDDSSTTQVKTVRIPLQSHHTRLTTGAQVEIGTTAGTTNAPANQIPALDTFLPEASKVYRQAWIESYANDYSNAGGAITQAIQIDNDTEVNRATLSGTLVTATFYKDHYIYPTNTYSTATAHAFKSRVITTSNRMQCLGAVLNITYEYNASTSTSAINSILVPISEKSGQGRFVGTSTTSNASMLGFDFSVEEPGPIELKQSGTFLYVYGTTTASTLNVSAGSQTYRTYAVGGPGSATSGYFPIVHRGDHSSGWTLTSGTNTLYLNAYTPDAEELYLYGYAIINYTSGVSSQGINSHNKTTCWAVGDIPTTSGVASSSRLEYSTSDTPVINESIYYINSSYLETVMRQSSASLYSHIVIDNKFNEQSGRTRTYAWSGGWSVGTTGELTSYPVISDITSFWHRTPVISGTPARANIETSRNIQVHSTSSSFYYSRHWLTTHSIAGTISGTISGYSGNGSGINYDVYTTYGPFIVASGTTSVGGVYSVNVPKNSSTQYFTVARQDGTHLGRSDNGTPS